MPELKNTSEVISKKNTFHLSGLLAERAVIFLLTKDNWSLILQRCESSISEIDLIFEKDQKVLLIEVKKLNAEWRSFQRIQRSQVYSLQKNLIIFSNKFPNYAFQALIAWVDLKNKISFVSIE